MPWNSPIGRPERGALARVLDRLLERAFGKAERDAGVEAALRVERVQQLLEAVLAQDQVLQRQLAVLELDLGEVLAAHRVVARGAPSKPGVSRLDQHAADAVAARLLVDAAEDDEPPAPRRRG